MKRDEAILEGKVLEAIGRAHDVALYRCETGQGFTGALARDLLETLGPGLTSHQRAELGRVLNKHRIRWGLGEGSPDLVGAVAGRFVGVELKSARGVVEPEQRDWHSAARAKGLAVFVARSVDDVLEGLARVRAGGLQ